MLDPTYRADYNPSTVQGEAFAAASGLATGHSWTQRTVFAKELIMGRHVIVSLAQIDVLWGQPEANLAVAEELVEEARRRGSDLILFPELWTTGFDLVHAGAYASAPGEGVFERLGHLARRNDIYIAGSILKRERDAIFNCAPLFSPRGDLVGEYDKVHLFGLMDEDRYLTAGNRTPVFDLPWGRCAVAICYDLRFPELFRRFALDGAEMVLLPAEWPYPRLEHWRTLLRARAIENEFYLVACNQVGRAGDTHFFGHSTIVDPMGRCAVEAGETAMLLTVSVDMDLVKEARSRLTVLQDRRPEVY
jgi:predicted amidohydrolase